MGTTKSPRRRRADGEAGPDANSPSEVPVRRRSGRNQRPYPDGVLDDGQERPARTGRPRDRSKDLAVLDATIKLLAESGLSGLSMDRVAAAAGVSKVTVYTRWSSKDELISAALNHVQVTHVPKPTGAVRSDLVAHLSAMRVAYEESGGMAILGNCLADEPVSGELMANIRRSTILPRRANFVEVVRAGIERGEIRSDIDPERVASMVIGVLYADHVAGLPKAAGWEESVVDDVLSGVGAEDRAPDTRD